FAVTIYRVFRKVLDAGGVRSSGAPRRFGEVLVIIGIGMLVVAIGYHVAFMIGLRRERESLKRDGLIHAESQFPASLTLMVAVVLFFCGLVAIYNNTIGGGR